MKILLCLVLALVRLDAQLTYEDMFNFLDENGDHVITSPEFWAHVLLYDVNGDGRVTYLDEFSPIEDQRNAESLGHFHFYDKVDGREDNYIDFNNSNILFGLMDADDNGNVTLDEFLLTFPAVDAGRFAEVVKVEELEKADPSAIPVGGHGQEGIPAAHAVLLDLQQAFNRIDTNSDKTISASEGYAYCHKVDANRDGKLTSAEFLAVREQKADANTEAILHESFKYYDTRGGIQAADNFIICGNGSVSLQEYDAIATQLGRAIEQKLQTTVAP